MTRSRKSARQLDGNAVPVASFSRALPFPPISIHPSHLAIACSIGTRDPFLEYLFPFALPRSLNKFGEISSRRNEKKLANDGNFDASIRFDAFISLSHCDFQEIFGQATNSTFTTISFYVDGSSLREHCRIVETVCNLSNETRD